MSKTQTIVMTRIGAVLGVSPPLPLSQEITFYRELEVLFPGISARIEEVLAAARPGGSMIVLPCGEGSSLQLFVVEALQIQRRKCDVERVLRDALAPIERQARERDISLKLETVLLGSPEAHLDPVKLAWVISALVGNSLRFVKSGSRHLPGGSITVKALRGSASGMLEFIVEDDGPGIPPEVVDEILKQSAERPPFRGVALRLARDIVEAHGGSFFVRTAAEDEGRGTIVLFRLPLTAL